MASIFAVLPERSDSAYLAVGDGAPTWRGPFLATVHVYMFLSLWLSTCLRLIGRRQLQRSLLFSELSAPSRYTHVVECWLVTWPQDVAASGPSKNDAAHIEGVMAGLTARECYCLQHLAPYTRFRLLFGVVQESIAPGPLLDVCGLLEYAELVHLSL